jgi:hypothetical protein
MVDLVGASLVVDLPEAKAHEGHVITAVELDGWGSHCEYSEFNRIESILTPGTDKETLRRSSYRHSIAGRRRTYRKQERQLADILLKNNQ